MIFASFSSEQALPSARVLRASTERSNRSYKEYEEPVTVEVYTTARGRRVGKKPEPVRAVLSESDENEDSEECAEESEPESEVEDDDDDEEDDEDDDEVKDDTGINELISKRKRPSENPVYQSSSRGGKQGEDMATCLGICKAIMQQSFAWPFLEPVSIKDVPDYHEIITSPMDLGEFWRSINRLLYYF